MSSTPQPSTIRLSTGPHLAVAFGATAATFLLLDAAWLTTMATRLYRPAIGHIMRPDFDMLAAAAFYAIYLAGVVFFAVRPAPDARAALPPQIRCITLVSLAGCTELALRDAERLAAEAGEALARGG